MKRISINILIALLLLLQSCIKEDYYTCESWLLLRFRYTLNDQYANLFDTEVQKITVYVFDNNGKYVDSFSEQGDKLTNDYVMRIPLPRGKYSIVAYGGNFTTYRTGELNGQNNTLNSTLRKGVTDISDFRAELKNITGAENYLYPANIPDDLYAGFVTDAVSAMDNQNITEVALIKDTKMITVRITGNIPMTTPFDIYITSTNGRYLADNSIDLNHGMFKYTPVSSTVQSNYMKADLKIMRLLTGQSPMLIIKNRETQDVLYNKNMIEQILLTKKYVTQEDLDREDHFFFEINIQSKDNDVEIQVTINGWKINNITPDAL